MDAERHGRDPATGQDETRPGPNALVDLVRASVIGDDEAVAGPVRRPAGDLRRLHGVGPEPLVHRGLHPRRGAAAVREHAHGVVGHGPPDDALPRGGAAARPRGRAAATPRGTPWSSAARARPPRSTGSSTSSTSGSRPTSTTAGTSGRGSRPTQRPVVFIGPYEHHSNELPWRESIADVVTIREDRDGHIDLAQLERRARPLRRPAAEDRLVLGRLERDRDHVEHVRDLAPAPRARRAVVLRLRGRGAVRRDRDGPARRSARLQGRGLHLAPQVHRRARDARRARRPPRAVPEPRPERARRRHRPVRQPVRARLPLRHRASRGGRHARDRRVDPRGPRVPAQGRRRRRGDPRARARLHPPRDGALVGQPVDRDPRQPTTRSGCRSCRSSSATTAATCTTTSSSRCSTTCSGSSRAAAARAPGRTATACWASTSRPRHEFEREIARGCEGIKPGWVRVNFNYFISEAVFEFILDAVDLVASDGLAPPARLRLRARRPACGATARAARSRRASLRDVRYDDGRMAWPSHRHHEPESRLADYLDEARELLARPVAVARRSRRSTTARSGRTSRRCAGSGSPRRWRRRPTGRVPERLVARPGGHRARPRDDRGQGGGDRARRAAAGARAGGLPDRRRRRRARGAGPRRLVGGGRGGGAVDRRHGRARGARRSAAWARGRRSPSVDADGRAACGRRSRGRTGDRRPAVGRVRAAADDGVAGARGAGASVERARGCSRAGTRSGLWLSGEAGDVAPGARDGVGRGDAAGGRRAAVGRARGPRPFGSPAGRAAAGRRRGPRASGPGSP